ncbi:phosphatidylinositol alpha-1,6-mannosyltransferase [Flavobacteriaceae bacterium MAR_2010_72]|nr:phosphatidylinositol alpha-1,6-mannosyltransferase [Flavobacteriaceae bacterium MAR_2010_72]
MTTTAKRILIVSSEFPPQPGGIGNHAHHLATNLQKQGCQVQVLCDHRSSDGELETAFDASLQVKVHRIAVQRLRMLMYFKRLQLLFRLIKEVDVVMASGKFSLWAVAFCSEFYTKKYIAIVHGTEVNFKPFVLRQSIAYALKRFHKVICVSNYTKSLIDYLQLKSVYVIPNGIASVTWLNASVEPMVIEGHPKLVTVGNVTERKGQIHVVKQLPELLKVFPDLHYHCIGIPTEKEKVLSVAKHLNVEQHVTFHGRVEEHQLQALLLGGDVFVMLSAATATGDVEGFGIAILEANALGLPAIGALECGIEDAIAHKQSGLLIPLGDPQSFIEAINSILNEKEGYAARAKAWAQQHDWGIIIKRYLELIGE